MSETNLQVQEKQMPAETHTEQLISAENAVRPSVDIFHTPEAYLFLVDLPGVKQDDIDLEISGRNVLSLRARNRFEYNEGTAVYRQAAFHNYYRSFELGDEVDREQVNAKLENGVLAIHIAKREAVRPRKIEVEIQA